jgi:hypothetical protein
MRGRFSFSRVCGEGEPRLFRGTRKAIASIEQDIRQWRDGVDE